MLLRSIVSAMLVAIAFAPAGQSQGTGTNADVRAGIRSLDLEPVWAGHPVGFALLTEGDRQYAAFYAADRRMTVAQRTLGERLWRYTQLDTSVGWDTHNYITMALDRQGYLHVMGNMHGSPLVYFRGTRPWDASSLERIGSMTGQHEERVTYPVFSYGPDGALLLQYRDGRSGSGDTFRNSYDESTRTWRSLTDKPLFFGGAKMNAYPLDPLKGPDGWYHQVWVWRDTPMSETNHDLSYARSRDLVHWETAGGTALTLPLTIETKGITVDAAPVRGGLLNGTQAIGFDAQGQVVISYIRYDTAGKSQLYFARFEGGRWAIRQASQWDYRWDFHGGGSIGTEIRVGPLRAANGKLTISIEHKIFGSGVWEVDPATMKLTRRLTVLPTTIAGLEESSATELFERTAADSGGPRSDGVSYRLTWKTLGENRDRPRPEGAPAATMLRLMVETAGR